MNVVTDIMNREALAFSICPAPTSALLYPVRYFGGVYVTPVHWTMGGFRAKQSLRRYAAATNTSQPNNRSSVQTLVALTLIRHSSSGMLSAVCLLTSLLHAVQMLALRGCGWNLAQGASPDKWIWLKSSGLVTGISQTRALRQKLSQLAESN